MTRRLGHYTECTNRVIALAYEAARQMDHQLVEIQHIWWGIVIEDVGMGGNILRNLGFESKSLYELIKTYSHVPRAIDSTTPPYMSMNTLEMLRLSIDEAHALKHIYITTGHLILGLFKQDNEITQDIAKRFKIVP